MPEISPTVQDFARAQSQLNAGVSQARTTLNAHNNQLAQQTRPYGEVRPTFRELQCQRMDAERSGLLERGGPDCITGAPVHGPTYYDPHTP